jgi:hypothetical protein
MDRREALKKLSAGGAIAAGGSVVLSSTNVAYAASNGTLPSAGWTYLGGTGSKRSVRLDLSPTTCVRSGEVATLLSSNRPNAAIDDKGTNATTLEIQVKVTGGGVWAVNDTFTVRWSINWDCAPTQTYDQSFVVSA